MLSLLRRLLRGNQGRPATRNAFCSFCRKNYRDVGPLVEGPGEVYICGACVQLCQSILDQERRRRADHDACPGTRDTRAGSGPASKNAFCSFCRTSYRDVGPLAEGPDGVYICGACIGVCRSIIHRERRRLAEREARPGTSDTGTASSLSPKNVCCSFCRKSYPDVGPVAEGPGGVYICGACIELCGSILQQERRRRAEHEPRSGTSDTGAGK